MIPRVSAASAGLFSFGVAPQDLLTMTFRELTYFETLALDIVKRRARKSGGK